MFWYALIASGLTSLYLWKKANPGKSINPMPTGEARDYAADIADKVEKP